MQVSAKAVERLPVESIQTDGTSLFDCETSRADEPVTEAFPVDDIVREQVNLPITPHARLTVVTHWISGILTPRS
jgi:hypothetical protein